MTLQRFLLDNASDGATATTANTGADTLIPGNGDILFDDGAARHGLGLVFASQPNLQTEGRWSAAAANATMSFRTWGSGPGKTPTETIGLLNLRTSSGVAIRMQWTSANALIFVPVSGSNLTLASNLDPTAQYDVSIRVVIGNPGSLNVVLRNNSGTSLGTITSSTFNSGTNPISGVGLGIVGTYSTPYTSQWDEISFDDGQTAEIPLYQPPAAQAAHYDLTWTGSAWRTLQQLAWDGSKWRGYNVGDVDPNPGTGGGTTSRDNLVLGQYKPSAATTGTIPGSTLTDVTTPTTYTQSGTASNPYIVENKRFMNRVYINGCKYITFRNCEFHGNPNPDTTTTQGAIQSTNGYNQNLVFQDCLITQQNPNSEIQVGVQGAHNSKFLRCEFHGSGDLIALVHSFPKKSDGSVDTSVWSDTTNAHNGPMNLEVYGCYFHDLAYFSPEAGRAPDDNASHCDCIQIRGGSNIIIRYNTIVPHLDPNIGAASQPPVNGTDSSGNPTHISGNKYYPDMNATSMLMVSPHLAPLHDIYVEYNWIDGGSFSINASEFGSADYTSDSNFNIRYNKWGRSMRQGEHATVVGESGARTSGRIMINSNTYEDNGQAANYLNNNAV